MWVKPEIWLEWAEHGSLCEASVHWLAEHGDEGDPHPISSGIETLRGEPSSD